MAAQWLAVQRFRHVQELLTAINALSIHLKLRTLRQNLDGIAITVAKPTGCNPWA
jgi:hypothetical protein